MAERLWRGPNQIHMTAPSETGPGIFDLREISPDEPAIPEYSPPDPSAKPRAKATRQTTTPADAVNRLAAPARDKVTWQDDRSDATRRPTDRSILSVGRRSMNAGGSAIGHAARTIRAGRTSRPGNPGHRTASSTRVTAAPAADDAAEFARPATAGTPPEDAASAAAAETPKPSPGQGSDIHIEFTAERRS